MGRRRVSGVSPSAYQWCGGSGARRCRFRSTGGQRAAPHGDFGNTSIDRSVRVRPAAPYGPRVELADGRAPRHGIRRPARRMVRRAAVARCEEAAAKSGIDTATGTRSPPDAGPAAAPPWGALARRRILTWGRVLAPASLTFHSALNPTGTRCRQRRIISSPLSASAATGGPVTVQ